MADKIVYGIEFDAKTGLAQLKLIEGGFENLSKSGESTAKNINDSYDKAFNNLLADTTKYYESVRFSDDQYFSWKVKKIQDEVAALNITTEQKKTLETSLITSLKTQQTAHFDNIANSSKQAAQKIEADFKNAQIKMAADLANYYNTVKFADANYYTWKVDQIKKEVSAMEISAGQKIALEKNLVSQLTAQQAAHFANNAAIQKTRMSFSELIVTTGQFTQILGSLKSAFVSIGTQFQESIGLSNQYETALTGLSKTAENFAQNQDAAKKAAISLSEDGLLNVTANATSLKFLMQSGFDLQQSLNLTGAAKDMGAFGRTTLDFNQAMMDFARGVKTGSLELTENIGFTQRFSAIMKEANVDISNGIDLRNNLAQREAFYNAVLKEGELNKGNAQKYLETTAGAMSAMSTQLNMLKKDIGDFAKIIISDFLPGIRETVAWFKDHLSVTIGILAGLITTALVPAIAAAGMAIAALGVSVAVATGGISLLVAGIAGVIALNWSDELIKQANASKDIADSAVKQKNTLDGLVATYEMLRDKTNLTVVEHKLLDDTIKKLQSQYPEYLKNLNFEKDGHDKIDAAIQRTNKSLENKIILQLQEEKLTPLIKQRTDLQIKENEILLQKSKAQAELTKSIQDSNLSELEKGAIQINVNEKIRQASELLKQNRADQKALSEEITNLYVNYDSLIQNNGEVQNIVQQKITDQRNKNTEDRIKSFKKESDSAINSENTTNKAVADIYAAHRADTLNGMQKELADLDNKHKQEIEKAKISVESLKTIEKNYLAEIAENKKNNTNNNTAKVEFDKAKNDFEVLKALDTVYYRDKAAIVDKYRKEELQKTAELKERLKKSDISLSDWEQALLKNDAEKEKELLTATGEQKAIIEQIYLNKRNEISAKYYDKIIQDEQKEAELIEKTEKEKFNLRQKALKNINDINQSTSKSFEDILNNELNQFQQKQQAELEQLEADKNAQITIKGELVNANLLTEAEYSQALQNLKLNETAFIKGQEEKKTNYYKTQKDIIAEIHDQTLSDLERKNAQELRSFKKMQADQLKALNERLASGYSSQEEYDQAVKDMAANRAQFEQDQAVESNEIIKGSYSALQGAINSFIQVGISGGNALKAAWQSFSQAIISMIAQMTAKAIAFAALEAFLKITSFGISDIIKGGGSILPDTGSMNIAEKGGLPEQFQRKKLSSGGMGGTLWQGNSHNQGGIPVEVEHDEITLTKGVYRNPLLRGIASMINVAAGGVSLPNSQMVTRLASGGLPPNINYNTTTAPDNSLLFATIESMGNAITGLTNQINRLKAADGRQVWTLAESGKQQLNSVVS